jgi:hypothetical protein
MTEGKQATPEVQSTQGEQLLLGCCAFKACGLLPTWYCQLLLLVVGVGAPMGWWLWDLRGKGRIPLARTSSFSGTCNNNG